MSCHICQVVLATSASLECGYAKETFIKYAADVRNSIIFTTTPPPRSFGARVLDMNKQNNSRVVTCSVSIVGTMTSVW